MSRLEWNPIGGRFFETGVSHVVLYPESGPGVAWNGVTSIAENSSGGDLESLYLDGVKYLDTITNTDFQATLQAVNAPIEFAACDGRKRLSPGLYAGEQRRRTFGLSWRTLVGNDLQGTEFGYKLHLAYNCTASPTSKTSESLDGDLPTPSSRSWEINTVPMPSNTYKPTAHFIVDSTELPDGTLESLENYLYGRDGQDPVLPDPDDISTYLVSVITETIEALI